MSLSVTVLGASGSFAAPDGACSGYLVRSDTTAIWVDCGPGTFAGLQRHLDPGDLDAIVVSHQHPDHWLELPVVFNAFRYVLGLADRALPVYWTAPTGAMFTAVSGHHDPAPTFAATVIDAASRIEVGDLRVRFARTHHPVETLAVRIDHPSGSLVYTADTGDGWDLAELADPGEPPIDLALVEATLDAPIPGVDHLTGAQAGAQASRAGVRRLVLTHVQPGASPADRVADARRSFAGAIDVATIDRTFEVSR